MLRLSLVFVLFSGSIALAQQPLIKGRITDAGTGEPLAGVNVFYSTAHGVATDEVGFYSIAAEPGRIRIQYRFVGYNTEFRTIDVAQGDTLNLDIRMTEQLHLLNELVVSASRYEQKISDVIVSMDVISSATIENSQTISIETALQQVQGVMFLDDQVSIRSGNGYSYGVGSRVLLLIDDLPMLTGGGGEAKWDFVPLENLSRVEVLKGASSALYGSSALNGVINIRTASPGPEPETRLVFYSGLYGQPKRKEIAWWGNTQPFYSGMRFSHSRREGNLDIVAGGNVFSDEGYRENENEQFARFNLNTRYRNRKVEGLSYGVNTNYMIKKGGNFLLWLDGDSGIYRASPDFDQTVNNRRFNIDPHLTYFTPNNSRHSFKSRIFFVSYDGDTLHNYDDSYFAEYQYQKRFENNLSLSAGTSTTYITSRSNLFGDTMNVANNYSLYAQADKRFGKWSFTFGGRYELHSLNHTRESSRPVLRAGFNYQASPFTFVRASFGQGFRYPTIAEKYASTQVGALRIFPNQELKPENGWNAEIGIKQGYEIGQIRGYLDAAVFWNEYKNMIEFTFGQHFPDSIKNPTLNQFIEYTGFKAENISNARITGFEINLIGEGRAGPFKFSYNAGYTYTNPIDLDFDKHDNIHTTTDKNILKYRFYHSSKAGFDISYRKLSSGFNVDYHSFIFNIDQAFEDSLRFETGLAYGVILPGMKQYRAKNKRGDILVNWRLAWEPATAIRLSFIINNLFNREYMTRPADVGPPRVFALQLAVGL